MIEEIKQKIQDKRCSKGKHRVYFLSISSNVEQGGAMIETHKFCDNCGWNVTEYSMKEGI